MSERAEALSIEEGGPSWALWMRVGLAPADPVPLGKRALVLALVCWAPLFALSALAGLARGDRVDVPFLRDYAAYTRFLLTILLLVLADASVAGRIRAVVEHFETAGLIGPDTRPAFTSLLASSRRLVASPWAELAMVALAYLVSFSVVQTEMNDGSASWHALPVDGGGEALTAAGWWYALVSVPLFQFLFMRWIFRGIVWARALARISRLDLRLVATHPDRAGGLAFVALGQSGFAILVLGASASLSGKLADEVVYRGVPLESLYPAMAAFAVVATLIVLAPLLTFTPKLAALKRAALFGYAKLSSLHDAAFDAKWRSPAADPEALLGDPDPSSLADLATGYERAREMRPIPVNMAAVFPLLFAAALPMLPLIATKVPLRDIVKGLLKVVL
jgi:hypothetical protein